MSLQYRFRMRGFIVYHIMLSIDSMLMQNCSTKRRTMSMNNAIQDNVSMYAYSSILSFIFSPQNLVVCPRLLYHLV